MRSLGSAPAAALALLLVASLTAAAAAAPALGDVRLAGTRSPRQGQVQVQVDGQWYSAVCHTDFSYESSGVPQVVCRQLGFSGGEQYFFDNGLPAGNDSVLTGALLCNGSEARLADCRFERDEAADAAAKCYSFLPDGFFLGVVCAGALQIEELRLAGGPSDSEGHVELRLANNSEWGTLCSNNAFAAQVVCRELGYDPAQALARVGGIYGDGGLEPAAKPLCIGNEEALEECKGTVLGSTDNCAAPAFGVSCNGSQVITGVRLADGPSAKQGRLQVQLLGNGSWHDVFFNGWVEEFVPIAQLVCHSLGFTGGVTRGGSWHGSDPEPGIAELECGPGAAGLNSCKFASAEFPTTDGEHVIAGLACDGAVAEIEGLRLANGTSEREGRVEVKLNGTWASVGINNGFEDSLLRNARVVCRQLGYGGGASRGGGPYGGGLKMINALTCQGNETDLNGCSWGTTDWGGDVLSVACEGAQTVSAVRLRNNRTASGSEGRLEVQIGGQWGTVCSYDAVFDAGAAAAACAQLGYHGQAYIVNGAQYSSDTSLPIIMSNVYCATNQTSLNACQFDMNNPDDCDHYYDVGLVCTGPKAS